MPGEIMRPGKVNSHFDVLSMANCCSGGDHVGKKSSQVRFRPERIVTRVEFPGTVERDDRVAESDANWILSHRGRGAAIQQRSV